MTKMAVRMAGQENAATCLVTVTVVVTAVVAATIDTPVVKVRTIQVHISFKWSYKSETAPIFNKRLPFFMLTFPDMRSLFYFSGL